jgi:Fe2+ transport system protein B
VINKIDLAPEGQLADLVDQLHQHRADVPIVPMVASRGQGFDALIAALDIAARGLAPSPGTSDAAHADHHSHPHAHAGDPQVEARQVALAFDEPIDAGELVRRVTRAVQQITRAISDHDGAVVGHVKAALEAEGRIVAIRATSARRPAQITGELPGRLTGAQLTINALSYNMRRRALAAATDAALGRWT